MSSESLSNIFETVSLLPTIRIKHHRLNKQFMREDLVMVLDHDVDILKIKDALDTINRRLGMVNCILVKRDASDPENVKFSKMIYDMATYDKESDNFIPVKDSKIIQRQWDNLDKPPSVDADKINSRKTITIDVSLPTEEINAEVAKQVEIIQQELHEIRTKQEADIIAQRSFAPGDHLYELHSALNQMFENAAESDIFFNCGSYEYLGKNDLFGVVGLTSELGIATAVKITGIPDGYDMTGYDVSDFETKTGDVVVSKPGDGYPEIYSPD